MFRKLATLSFLSICCALVAACAPATGGNGGGTGGMNDSGVAQTGGSGGAAVGTGGSATGGAPVGTGGSATGGAGMSGGVGTGGSSVGSGGQNASGGSASGGGAGTGATGRGGAAGGAGRIGTGGASNSGGAGGRGSCMGAVYNSASPPTTVTLSGNLGVHDPAALILGSTIYLVATGQMARTGLDSKTSTNLTSWTAGSNPLGSRPAWIAQMVPAATKLWAPDISNFGGMYHMYYSASSFGCNRSCIGHATRASLDSGSWADQGPVICSNMGAGCRDGSDNWNAIDPNIVVDDAGTPWMAFGSFWGGLKMIQLDGTGARADTTLLSIAHRPNASGALEGPWIFKNCGYYYLFVSWGACCDGAFDYNMRVGRSTNVTGPYVDKAGTQMMQGGGTLLVQGNASWGAPGHNAVITHGAKTYNIYHALQGGRGTATLRIAEIAWDADGWPFSGGP